MMESRVVPLSNAAEGAASVASAEESSFSRSVSALLEHIEYRRCESGEDIEAIYRLRYDAYLASGMITGSSTRIVEDEFDDLPNSYRFGIFIDGELASTIRVHHVHPQMPVSPSVQVFGDELKPRLAAGETFIDPSRFAADSEFSRAFKALPYVTLRLAVAACSYFDVDYCLTAIKEEHTGFYRRIFGSEQTMPSRTYPGLVCPVYLFQSKCSENMAKTIERFPFFKSTPFEQRMLFARPPKGELAPLTILPTAKYMKRAA
jgi:hypothetical protein